MKLSEHNYRNALQAHDWFYQYSDDHGVWAKGRSQYKALVEMQKDIDPAGAIWNEYAPQEMKIKN